MSNSALNKVDKETMLRCTHQQLRLRYGRMQRELCSFVADVCGVGSTSAYDICVELGWDPSTPAGKSLPLRKK